MESPRRSCASHVVAVSGPICAGKTTLALRLAAVLSARLLRTRLVLQSLGLEGYPRDLADRRLLQRVGESFDEADGGRWVAEAARNLVGYRAGWVVVDAVRVGGQISGLRSAFAAVVHIHLFAAEEVLDGRYKARRRHAPAFEPASLAVAREDPTESQVTRLADLADVVIDTTAVDPAETERHSLVFLEQAGLWTSTEAT